MSSRPMSRRTPSGRTFAMGRSGRASPRRAPRASPARPGRKSPARANGSRVSSRSRSPTAAAKNGKRGKAGVSLGNGKLSWWKERVIWYPGGCFGPYRAEALGYSRRELLADAAVHVLSIGLGCIGVGCLAYRVVTNVWPRSPPLALGLGLYGASLLTMFCCSALFNLRVGFVRHRPDYVWALQLADHTGILLLIAGTYTPFMLLYCYPRILAFVWATGLASFLAKASRSPLDLLVLHVPCFLAMGWSVTSVADELLQLLPMRLWEEMVVGGTLYTIGLIPWALSRLEFHNAIWHLFVLGASGVFFRAILHEVADPELWPDGVTADCGWS